MFKGLFDSLLAICFLSMLLSLITKTFNIEILYMLHANIALVFFLFLRVCVEAGEKCFTF